MKKVTTSKNGYVTEIRDENDNLGKEIKIRGSIFRYNAKHKTYNNVVGNQLLHNSSILLAQTTAI